MRTQKVRGGMAKLGATRIVGTYRAGNMMALLDAKVRGVGADGFQPYRRDPETLARPWAVPGTPGLEHRIGGLEKGDGHGNISYDPANHDFMTRTRQAKVDGIAADPRYLDIFVPAFGLLAGRGPVAGRDVAAGVASAPSAAARR